MSRKIEIQSLRLFKAVADLENIAQAAKQEHIAASAVSKRISDLESALGTQLLYRLRRGVLLTPAGFTLLHHASRILEIVKQLEVDLTEYEQGIRGHVRIMANISAIVQFLPMDLSSFSTTHQPIKIDVREAATPNIITAVANGLTDVGIVCGDNFPQGVQNEPYRSDELALVVPQDHPLAGNRSIAFSESLEHDFIGLGSESGWQMYIDEAAAPVQMPLKIRIRVPSFDAMIKMVEAGLGISVMPIGIFESATASSHVKIISLRDKWAKRTLRVCYKGFGTTLSPAAQLLVEHFRKLVVGSQ